MGCVRCWGGLNRRLVAPLRHTTCDIVRCSPSTGSNTPTTRMGHGGVRVSNIRPGPSQQATPTNTTRADNRQRTMGSGAARSCRASARAAVHPSTPAPRRRPCAAPPPLEPIPSRPDSHLAHPPLRMTRAASSQACITASTQTLLPCSGTRAALRAPGYRARSGTRARASAPSQAPSCPRAPAPRDARVPPDPSAPPNAKGARARLHYMR